MMQSDLSENSRTVVNVEKENAVETDTRLSEIRTWSMGSALIVLLASSQSSYAERTENNEDMNWRRPTSGANPQWSCQRDTLLEQIEHHHSNLHTVDTIDQN